MLFRFCDRRGLFGAFALMLALGGALALSAAPARAQEYTAQEIVDSG